MTLRSRLDDLERQVKAAEAALTRHDRLPRLAIIVNSPEAGLEALRLPAEVLALNQTIHIGSLTQPDLCCGDDGA